jgi:hypothetical protein
MRILCWYCHKPCSNELPDNTVFRALAVCPECISKSPESENLKTTEDESTEVG